MATMAAINGFETGSKTGTFQTRLVAFVSRWTLLSCHRNVKEGQIFFFLYIFYSSTGGEQYCILF